MSRILYEVRTVLPIPNSANATRRHKKSRMTEEGAKLSIYRAARTIRRRDNTLYNALRSIYEDSIFVDSTPPVTLSPPMATPIIGPSIPLASISMLLTLLKGGCFIVDSTRRGKRFPDSMSKTIPIWTCVLNRAIRDFRKKFHDKDTSTNGDSSTYDQCHEIMGEASLDWDCSLHLPLWVSETEKASIEERLEEWTERLKESGADIASLSACLKKPLRPLWISQRTLIWINEVPHHDSWDFTPIILVSASSSTGISQNRTTSEFSWSYIPGAGDGEESWAMGLSPNLFWNNVYDIIHSGPDVCNQKVADIVEKRRVYCSYRGENAPQITVKSSDEDSTISWIGSTNLSVGTSHCAAEVPDADCILNCDHESISGPPRREEAYLHLPIVTSKYDRFSLLNNLPSVVSFARLNLSEGKRLLVCCSNGEDISVCVCLAILTSLFSDEGKYDGGKSFSETCITKLEMRRRLVYICRFVTNARPSRGNLRQVFNFLIGLTSPQQPSADDCN
ncbi:hypothetical protein K1719_010032 [Acacia pycnantha]|nr:hypothetical protein K1719_010032 [Acacia pycnantha]